MKKILFIDPLSPEGHVQYNKYWFEAFNKLGYDYKVIFKEEYKKNFKLQVEVVEIPKVMYERVEKSNNFITKRYHLFKILKYIKKISDREKYEYVVFSSFENFSMLLYCLLYKKNKFFFGVLHNNLEKLNNKLVYFVIKFISKKINLITLDTSIKEELIKLKINNNLIRHPLPEAFIKKILEKEENIFVYSPSKTSIDEDIISELIRDESFFQNNKIKLFMRSSKVNYESKKIKISNKFLSQIEYETNFLKADVILLPYKKTFQNRVSNIFFEAIANKKKIGILKGSFLENYLDENIFKFENIIELKEELLKVKKENKIEYGILKESLSQEIMRKEIENLFGE